MMDNNLRGYKLKKDMPGVKANSLFVPGEQEGSFYFSYVKDGDDHTRYQYFMLDEILENPDWFEPVYVYDFKILEIKELIGDKNGYKAILIGELLFILITENPKQYEILSILNLRNNEILSIGDTVKSSYDKIETIDGFEYRPEDKKMWVSIDKEKKHGGLLYMWKKITK